MPSTTNSTTRTSGLQNRAAILIAQNFDEGPVVQCLSQTREAGIAVSLVSLSAGLMSSAHGLMIRPDLLIDQLFNMTLPRLVVVAGGPSCALALMADPRVHQLIDTVLDAGGFVAAMSTAQSSLNDMGTPKKSTSSLLLQNNLEIDQFISQLINLISGG